MQKRTGKQPDVLEIESSRLSGTTGFTLSWPGPAAWTKPVPGTVARITSPQNATLWALDPSNLSRIRSPRFSSLGSTRRFRLDESTVGYPPLSARFVPVEPREAAKKRDRCQAGGVAIPRSSSRKARRRKETRQQRCRACRGLPFENEDPVGTGAGRWTCRR